MSKRNGRRRPTGASAERRFGAILWETGVEVHEAIRAVKVFPDADDAIAYVAPACTTGQRWAVVDLVTMAVVAEGARNAARPGQGTRTPVPAGGPVGS
jgi:hypothetical protein